MQLSEKMQSDSLQNKLLYTIIQDPLAKFFFHWNYKTFSNKRPPAENSIKRPPKKSHNKIVDPSSIGVRTVIGKIFSSDGATLFKNPSDQTVYVHNLRFVIRSNPKFGYMLMPVGVAQQC